jgi:hypothetical protein
MKKWVQAVAGLSGVRGGSAQGQISRGTWETRYGGDTENAERPLAGRDNRERLVPGVGEARSSEEVR